MVGHYLRRGATLAALILALAGCNGGGGSSKAPEAPSDPRPAPVETVPLRSYLGAAGIGVADLEAATAFYTTGLGMKEKYRLTRTDREEVVFESADGRGSEVVLMHYTDGSSPNYRQNPGKLVFYAKDPAAFAQSIRDAGGVIVAEPANQGPALGNAIVGFGRDLDNNLIEIVGDAGATHSYFGAIGIGVSDLEAAKTFYTDVLGMTVKYYLPIPGLYNEYILESAVPGGSGVVLMHYTNGSEPNYRDNPVKLVYRTSDPAALAARIEAAGLPLVVEPGPAPEPDLEGATVGYAKDMDGYLLEIVQTTKAYLGAAGIGVSDLEAAVAFYKNGLGMKEIARVDRADRAEVILESADGRGSDVVLMHYTDGSTPDYGRNPGKLVFYAKDPTAFAQSIRDAGGVILLEPVSQGPALGNAVVGFGRDLDNNLIEIVGDPAATHSYFGALGIGVADLEASMRFYTDTLGMKRTYFLSVRKPDGSPHYDEYILEAAGGSAVVLMHYTDGSVRNYRDNPVKLEFRTLAPQPFAAAIEAAGMPLLREPAPTDEPDLAGALVGYAKDADGYLLEIRLTP